MKSVPLGEIQEFSVLWSASPLSTSTRQKLKRYGSDVGDRDNGAHYLLSDIPTTGAEYLWKERQQTQASSTCFTWQGIHTFKLWQG